VIKSLVPTTKMKNVTLAFGRRVSEAGFGELMDLLDFRFGKGSCFEVVSWSHFGVAAFSSEVFFLSTLHFGVAFFHRRSFFLASYVLGLPLFSSGVFFLSPLCFEVTSFFIGGLFS
jgi:hypothetical protein